MPKINYFDGKKYIEVEVSDEVAKAYADISQAEKREHWRSDKRGQEDSIEEMLVLGMELTDDTDILRDYIDREERDKLKKAILMLTPNQQELLKRIMFKKQSLKLVAEDYGISYQAIQNRLNKIFEKIRKNF